MRGMKRIEGTAEGKAEETSDSVRGDSFILWNVDDLFNLFDKSVYL